MTYTVSSGVLNSTPTNNWCYIVSLFVSCAFPLTPYSSLFPYLSPHLSFPLRIDPFCFHAGRRKRRLNLCWFHVIVHFFWTVNVCFCRVLGLVFFHTKARDWLGETSPKWPSWCRVGRRTTTQSISQSAGRPSSVHTRYANRLNRENNAGARNVPVHCA